jgi:hypothetical protein
LDGLIGQGGVDDILSIEPATLARDPSKHMLYGISVKWSTTVNKVPRGRRLALKEGEAKTPETAGGSSGRVIV